MIPTEVQGYLRHILHALGVMIVTVGGLSDAHLEILVGLAVNLISLGWFAYVQWQAIKKRQAEEQLAKIQVQVEDVADPS